MKGVPRQADIKLSPRRLNIWPLDWGDTHGKYSCLCFMILDVITLLFGISPGRFFAVNEVKALFAHIVATYDVKFEDGKEAPQDVCIAALRFPGKANVMFRARRK